MRRREFIALLGGAAVTGPFTTALRATAQPTANHIESLFIVVSCLG